MTVSVVLVEGGWSTAAVYDALIGELRHRGVAAVASSLNDPETGARLWFGAPATSARLREVIESTDDPVVLAGHSGGGIDITAVGDHPSVAHMVFLSAFMPGSAAEVSDWRSRATVSFDGTFSHYDPDGARKLFFGDLTTEAADAAVAAMVPNLVGEPVPEPDDPSWRHRPTTFVVFDRDLALTREDQLAWAADCDEVAHVVSAAHFGFVSHPGQVADILAGIARQYQ